MPDFGSALWNKPTSGDTGEGSGGASDPVTRSLRFESGATHRLTKTFGSAPSSNKVSTLAFWVKRSKLGSDQDIISANGTSHSENTNTFYVRFKSDDTLAVYSYPDPSNNTWAKTTSRKFRDVGAWMHIAILINTDESAAADRCKIYINGVREPSANLSGTNPSSGATNHLLGKATTTWYGSGSVNVQHCIGDEADRFRYKYSGYLADFYFIDGSAVEPDTNFIESTGYSSCKPKAAFDMSSYSGNSFHFDAQPAHDADLLVTSVGRSDGDTTFVDVAKGHTITKGGDPEHSNTVGNPFDSSGTAISFDGTGDYLSVATSSDFDFGSGSYTYEGWFYFNGFSETPDGIFSRNNSSTQEWAVCTNSSGTLQFFESVNNSYNTSSFTFSTGQWYHIALCKNGTTYKVYVDADEKISATLSSAPDANLPVIIGRFYDNYDGYYLDGYCYDFRAQKGVDTGGSKPSAPFELNPVYIGGDQSGNKNHFEPTNISSHDVMLDTPTKNYATLNPLDIKNTVSSTSEGNLKLTGYISTYYPRFTSTIAVNSGKWYWEVCKVGTSTTWSNEAGVKAVNTPSPTGGFALGGGSAFATYQELSLNSYDGNYRNGSGSTVNLGAWNSDEDIIGIALDLDSSTKTIQFYKNGSALGSAQNIPAGEYTWTPAFDCLPSSGTNELRVNYGQDNTFAGKITSGQDTSQSEFYYAPPTGFQSLNTSNLDDPAVKPAENFNTVLYTGTRDNSNSLGATSNAVTGMGFEPSLLWIKDRDNQSNNSSGYQGHYLFDSVQGSGKAINIDGGYYTGSNDFSGSLDGYNGVSSFDSDGFTLDESEAVNFAYDSDWNGSIDTYERYAAWGWKLGSNGSSSTWAAGNTDPTTEKYNASAGVSVIRQEESSNSYPMTGVTVNHSLGEAPEFAFLIDVTSNTYDIFAWHKDLDANKYLKLNQNSAQTTGSGYFPSGCSTATTFQIGGDIAGANSMDGYWDIYLYLFSGVDGYSKFGTYDPNGNVDGPFIYTGFRPAFVLTKRIDSSGFGWGLKDSARDTYNPADALLHPNTSGAETTNEAIDLLSNGFKIRATNNTINSSSSSAKYIYACFAEQPFAAPSNAR